MTPGSARTGRCSTFDCSRPRYRGGCRSLGQPMAEGISLSRCERTAARLPRSWVAWLLHPNAMLAGALYAFYGIHPVALLCYAWCRAVAVSHVETDVAGYGRFSRAHQKYNGKGCKVPKKQRSDRAIGHSVRLRRMGSECARTFGELLGYVQQIRNREGINASERAAFSKSSIWVSHHFFTRMSIRKARGGFAESAEHHR